MQAASSFGAHHLPLEVHLRVLSFLPLVERVRCALVAGSWAALLREPLFWAELRFDGVPEGCIKIEALLELCRRAKGCLRVLDVASPACEGIATEEVITVLACGGLGLHLETLSVKRIGARARARAGQPEASQQAAALLACCPALTSVSTLNSGSVADSFAALGVLPVLGSRGVSCNERVHRGDESPTPSVKAEEAAADRHAFTAWATAEPARPVKRMWLMNFDDFPAIFADEDGERAAALLAAALAAPGLGPRSITVMRAAIGATSLFRRFCRALSAESPLEYLRLFESGVDGSGAAELAAVLASGRSRLQSLALDGDDLSADGGCALG